MIFVNRSLDAINHKIQEQLKPKKADKVSSAKNNTTSKPLLQKPDRHRFLNDRSNELSLVSKIRPQHQKSIRDNSDLTQENLSGSKANNTDIKNNIISLLQNTNKPTSFYDIAKHLSNGSPDYNFEFILKELDRLKAAEKIVGQVSAGKLYFQLK